MIFLHVILAGTLLYLLISLYLVYLVHQIPRRPVQDFPDWGHVTEMPVRSVEGGLLEAWKIEPEAPSRGIVVLAHGWSRNRDRMVRRAAVFGDLGFTAVIHSARDHGGSSRRRFMNAFRFAEDIEAVLRALPEPVLLYGHSAGAAGAIIAAHRNPHLVKALFLEGCYPRTTEALRSLYRSYNRFLGFLFAPFVVFLMNIFYRFRLNRVSPAELAPDLDIPVLVIHGELDESFPLDYARRLRDRFPPGRGEMFIGHNMDHSGSSRAPEYPGAIRSFVDRHFPSSGSIPVCP